MTAPQDETNKPLDLSGLQSLNFGPNWATAGEAPKISAPREFRDRDSSFGGERSHGQRPDRRGFGGGDRGGDRPRSFGGGERRDSAGGSGHSGHSGGSGGFGAPGGNRFGGDRRDFRGDRGPRRDNAGEPRRSGFDPESREFSKYHPRPQPVADIGFFPEEKTFNVLIKALKASMRTYELFEIAHLILEKPERFVIGVRALDADRSAEKKYVFQSVPDGIPFLSESDAVAHVMRSHLERFFTKEIVEIEPPKGNFQMVSKCGLTGEILGPPNYHGYQQSLREHHSANFPQMDFGRFTSRIESSRDPEQINKWLEKMKQTTRYTLVNAKEGETAQFESLESAKAHLLANRKEQVVRPLTSIRFSGKLIEKMPNGPLRSSIENDLAYQRRFPLGAANFLRNYLRNAGFIFSKGGSKGFTYVCSVKRKYRTPQTVFADAIQRVFDFVEKHQRINIADLPVKYLGLTADAPPAACEISPATETSATETSATETPVTDVTQTAESASPEASENPAAAEQISPETSAESATTETEAPAATPPADTAEPVAEKPARRPERTERPRREKPQPVVVDLNNPAVRELLNTLRWLVSEGYVVEYSDGKLFALPVLTEAQMKSMSASKKKTGDKKSSDNAEDGGDDEIIPATE